MELFQSSKVRLTSPLAFRLKQQKQSPKTKPKNKRKTINYSKLKTMSTIFTKIIEGEIPANFAYADQTCVVIATIAPVTSGHMLVIPRTETPSYSECDDQTLAHISKVAKIIAKAQEKTFPIQRSGIVVAGFEVPHLHIHVIPLKNEKQLNLGLAKTQDIALIQEATQKLRKTLVEMGYEQNVPTDMTKLD